MQLQAIKAMFHSVNVRIKTELREDRLRDTGCSIKDIPTQIFCSIQIPYMGTKDEPIYYCDITYTAINLLICLYKEGS